MENKKMNFIHTSDRETASYLKKCGFTEIENSCDNYWCFVNDGKLTFETEHKKFVYTNMLTF